MALDFVLRCTEAGHDCKWFKLPGTKPNRDGEGFKGFEIVADWREYMRWAKEGLIWCSGNFKYLTELDRYRDLGFKIFAPTVASAKLEIERETGLKAMEAAGIEVPHYEVFGSLQEAERYARKMDKCFVFKTMGDEEDKSLSYVSCDPADMVGWLRHQIELGKKPKGKVMLQEKIEMVAELGVSGWFGPQGFLENKWQLCFEHKKLMPGEYGPNTGEMGTVCQYVETDKLAADLLVPMVGALKKAGHCGDFAVGAGIDRDGRSHPFEFTARAGWPAFWLQLASHKGDPAQWMRDLLDGKDTLKVSNDVCIGVVMGQPKFPYNKSTPEEVEGNPIQGLDEVWDDVHLASAMIAKGVKMTDGKVVDGLTHQTTGEYVCCCTALGKTVEAAQKKVYKVVDKVRFPNAIFRNDIGNKVIKSLPELHKLGYCRDMH